MTLVAISAAYGAGGSRIGPAIAERLGVPFLDRAIPVQVAERLDVPLGDLPPDEGEGDDEDVPTLLERLVAGFVGADNGIPAPPPAQMTTADDVRVASEALLRERAADGAGVILGRGAVAVLRRRADVLRVRLTGPPDRRARVAMALGHVDLPTATRALRHADRAHAEYVRRFYDVEIDDPALYHLVIDTTAFDLATCVDLVTRAASGLATASR